MKQLCLRLVETPRGESLETVVRDNGGWPVASRVVLGGQVERLPSPLYGSNFEPPAFSQALLNAWAAGGLEAVAFELDASAAGAVFEGDVVISSEDDLHKWDGIGVAHIHHELLVAGVGGAFFRHIITERPAFRTNNTRLFDSLYLPIELARDGKGVFFQERLVNRLLEIGLIEEEDDVQLIEDLGGWNSIGELTASIAVTVTRNGITRREVLLAHALVPAPPVRPEMLSTSINARRQTLAALGVRSSVLECIPGVVYERGLPESVVASIRDMKDRASRTVVTAAAQLLGLRDAGVFEASDCAPSDQISADYVELSTESDVQGLEGPSLLTCLKTDGALVYWSDLRRPFSAYVVTNGREFETLSRLTDRVLQEDARNAYFAGLVEGRQLVGVLHNNAH